MEPRPTASACSRNDASVPDVSAPSWTRSASWTLPRSRPSVLTTSRPSRSVSLMAGSGDLADDDIAGPVLGPVAVELLARHRDLDVLSDPRHAPERDRARRRT